MHLCRGWTADLQQRLAIYRTRGQARPRRPVVDLRARRWLTPHNKPLLRSSAVMRWWHCWTWPNLTALVAARGFADVDLLYIDSMHQSFWLDLVCHRRSVYRVPDYNPHFEKYTAAAAAAEQEMAQRVDLVVYLRHNSFSLTLKRLAARQSLLLVNGVDYAHFAGQSLPRPSEYRALHGAIAIYVGVIPDWFHFDWLRHAAAAQLPGNGLRTHRPGSLARERLSALAQCPSTRHSPLCNAAWLSATRPRGPDAVQRRKQPARRGSLATPETPRLFRKRPARGIVRLEKSSRSRKPRAQCNKRSPICGGVATCDDHESLIRSRCRNYAAPVQLGSPDGSARGASRRSASSAVVSGPPESKRMRDESSVFRPWHSAIIGFTWPVLQGAKHYAASTPSPMTRTPRRRAPPSG